MRLARYVVGTLDVDGMLDQISPDQFEEWCVYDELEPLSHQTDMLSGLAWDVSRWLYAQSDGSSTPELRQYMPWLPEQEQRSTRRTFKAMLNAQLGDQS